MPESDAPPPLAGPPEPPAPAAAPPQTLEAQLGAAHALLTATVARLQRQPHPSGGELLAAIHAFLTASAPPPPP